MNWKIEFNQSEQNGLKLNLSDWSILIQTFNLRSLISNA